MRAPDLPTVFSRSQALALGVGDVRLAGLVRRGQLVRLRHGMYAVAAATPGAPDDLSSRHVVCARAALSHHQSGFAASHLTAAAIHGLPLPPGGSHLVHVTAVDAYQRSRISPGVRVHHADSFPTDVIEALGLVVTSVPRTVADCLRMWPPETSVPIADAALRRGIVTPEELEDQLDRQRHWRGRPRALRSLQIVDGRRESWLESYAFVTFLDWGVPLPEPQVWVENLDGIALGRVDGAWIDDATVLELDGAAKYLMARNGEFDPIARWRLEKTRYDAMGNLGLERVRLSYDDLHRRPTLSRRVIDQRRATGSLSRFAGTFRRTDGSGLRCLSV